MIWLQTGRHQRSRGVAQDCSFFAPVGRALDALSEAWGTSPLQPPHDGPVVLAVSQTASTAGVDLGAGRSQVQILSPRLKKFLQIKHFGLLYGGV